MEQRDRTRSAINQQSIRSLRCDPFPAFMVCGFTLTAKSVTQPPGLILVGAICYNTAHRNPFARRNMSNPNDKFTWIPVYKAIAKKLLEYRIDQPGLIDMLREILNEIVPTWCKNNFNQALQDKIDPFSFFSVFNNRIEIKLRIKIIQAILSKFELDKDSPCLIHQSDFSIIPKNSRLSRYNTKKNNQIPVQEKDIDLLWDIAEEVINNGDCSDNLLTQCLNIEGLGLRSLTTGLFWFCPKRFIVITNKTKEFLGLPKKIGGVRGYRNILQDIREKFKDRGFENNRFFAEVTYEAMHNAPLPPPPPPEKPNEPIIAAIEQILDHKRQVILYGPPGTGKTYWANKAAKHLTNGEEHRVVTCTFHPEYGYEHFIEGFKPSLNESNQMIFKLEPGIFKELCKKASEDKDNKYYLIIDEINRGDIPRIFGELITLIEKDKRGTELTLPHSGKPFSVPENVYIIATMNTADRSIALLDIALRRRFGFLEIMPKPELVPNELRDWFSTLNNLLIKNLGQKKFEAENKQIGHSYFMKKDNEPPVDVSFVLEYEIQPLIEEYCYEMKEIPLEIRKHFEKLLPPKKERWELPKEKNSQETNASQTVAEPQS